jgi:hypothetical protein
VLRLFLPILLRYLVNAFGRPSDLSRLDQAFRAYASNLARFGIGSEQCRKLNRLFSSCVDREDASIEDIKELRDLCGSAANMGGRAAAHPCRPDACIHTLLTPFVCIAMTVILWCLSATCCTSRFGRWNRC